MFIFPLSFWLLLAEEFFVRRLLSCNRNYVSVYFLSPEGLSFFHGLIYNSCNASTESGFARLSECGEVKDESQRSPIGNLSTASWKPLALYVMSCITSDVPNCKPQRAVSMKILLDLSAFAFAYVKRVTYLALSLVTKEVPVLFNGIVNTWSEEQAVWKLSPTGFSFCSRDKKM